MSGPANKVSRVLVANRGEIAARVIRGCKEMGCSTVAVYSDVDAQAPYVVAADHAEHIGPPEPAKSYLDIGGIIDAAVRSGADAIHPGYGFLSENAAFSAACVDAGLTFIGPTAATIELLGDKGAARTLAESAGVPVPPGQRIEPTTDLVAEAEAIGFPVLLKAAAGGGGKGMRVVHEASALHDSLDSARREAQAAFGDDRVILEKFIERPRHIEIQVLADSHGAAVHLGERECSVQRRHQKIIEESPSPIVDSELREAMGAAALKVVQAAGYRNAGTVEFLVGADKSFYFLEVNTRLQVEHPVTELVMGVDLVHEQIRVARDEPLSIDQAAVVGRGHAIEARVYAEDPAQGFAPAPGPVLALSEPVAPGVRVDSGACAGQPISVYYDPIVAKVIAFAPERELAIDRLDRALADYVLLGARTNVAYLRAVLQHSAFREGDLTTHFVDDHLSDWSTPAPDAKQAAIAAALSRMVGANPRGGGSGAVVERYEPWRALGAWRNV